MRLGDVVEPCLAQKALHRLLGRLCRRALDLFLEISGARRQATDVQRQPPRRPVFARRLIGQPGFHQRVGDQLFEITRRLALHAGGNFLGTEFKQKIGHQFVSTGIEVRMLFLIFRVLTAAPLRARGRAGISPGRSSRRRSGIRSHAVNGLVCAT